jgi:hypothetical protein
MSTRFGIMITSSTYTQHLRLWLLLKGQVCYLLFLAPNAPRTVFHCYNFGPSATELQNVVENTNCGKHERREEKKTKKGAKCFEKGILKINIANPKSIVLFSPQFFCLLPPFFHSTILRLVRNDRSSFFSVSPLSISQILVVHFVMQALGI